MARSFKIRCGLALASLTLVLGCASAKAGKGSAVGRGGPHAAPSLLRDGELDLNETEEAQLSERGFVISDRHRFRSFAEGWLTIFKADLPLYVSADALLHVVHRSYDAILRDIEYATLIPTLERLLNGMRGRLEQGAAAGLSPQAHADADFFLSVALSLLQGSDAAPVAGAAQEEIQKWLQLVHAAKGANDLTLFGSGRSVDLSQFQPRGHYADSDAMTEARMQARSGVLADYFRATMWLGRIDARLTVKQGATIKFQRREFDLACALRALMGPEEMKAWSTLETTLNTFVGERDAMGPADLDRLYRDLSVTNLEQLAKLPDATIYAALVQGKYGEQRIRSDLLGRDYARPGFLPKSFSFTGQRYTIDSEVLSQVVDDRVAGRMLPNPLDVAYAVLKNDQAHQLLASELQRYKYDKQLRVARTAIDAHTTAFWSGNLYNLWLDGVRSLATAPGTELPALFRSEPWRRRVLNTQLASWAELRHDTILYTKQSYTSMALCSFPDVFVDPYPAFYDRLQQLGRRGQNLLRGLTFSDQAGVQQRAEHFFTLLAEAAQKLKALAEAQRRDQRPSAEILAWVNEAVVENPPFETCGGPPPLSVHGWYTELFYDGNPLEFKPTIADVHTQPTDEVGTPVGHVLHVGTGSPRLMVVDVAEDRRFVGVVSSYSEVTTSNFERLTDEIWEQRIAARNPADVPWMQDLVVR